MKTLKGLSFGMGVVNAGQRAVSEEPELVVCSTSGGFRASAAVTRALGVGHGEYIMFIQNVDNISTMIASKAEEFVAFAQEQGLDVDSAEAAAAFHAEFDIWGIAKGIPLYDKNGNPQMIRERMTNADKAKYLENHFEEVLNGALENGDEEIKAALTAEGVDEIEQKRYLMNVIQGDEVQKYQGSKCANTSAMLGAGTILNFTDSNVWMRLKAGMGDDATKKNRIYSVDLEELQTITVFDGKKDVTVKVAILGEYKDAEPIRIKK